MVILISGHSCTGKTLMSQNLLEKYKIPYYSIDNIKMGIFRSDENCGFTPTNSNSFIGNKLWPIIKGIIMTSIENEQDIIIEGCYILPQFLNMFEEEYSKHIIPVFLVFSKEYIEEKFETNILRNRNVIEKRLYEEDRSVENFVEEHNTFKMLCEENNSHYFEINDNYKEEILNVYDYIEEKVNKLASCNTENSL